MNEPAVLVIWGDRTLPVSVTQHSMEGRGGTHLEAHNVYGLLQAEAAYASLRESRPENRPFIVSRSGWTGLQRDAWTWTGDIETTWNGLRQTIPTILGLGLSGIPYSGADIGGFKGNPSAELYLRWLQMSCFLPFCRTHCSDDSKPRTPWGYGEPYLRIAREFLKLRDLLLPYFYNLAQEATQTGFPLVRPLFWLDSSNDRLWNIDDAFLLGNQIIVSPILEENTRSRSVFLPRGQWYHFWDHQCFDGEQTIEIKAPLEQIPVFIQSGTILPMRVEHRLELHIYLPIQDTTELLLYSDADDGYGASRCDRFQVTQVEKFLKLTWAQTGAFAFPYASVWVKIHSNKTKIEQAQAVTQWEYSSQSNGEQVRHLQVELT